MGVTCRAPRCGYFSSKMLQILAIFPSIFKSFRPLSAKLPKFRLFLCQNSGILKQLFGYFWVDILVALELPAAIMWKIHGSFCSPTELSAQHMSVPYSKARVGVKVSKLVDPLFRINLVGTVLASAELLKVHLEQREKKNFHCWSLCSGMTYVRQVGLCRAELSSRAFEPTLIKTKNANGLSNMSFISRGAISLIGTPVSKWRHVLLF